MASIFTQIVRRQAPAHRVAESRHCLAFLNIAPQVKGHTLVIPKREEDRFFDLTAEELKQLICFAQQVAHALRDHFPSKRVGMSVHGFEIPHAHIHLYPLVDGKELAHAFDGVVPLADSAHLAAQAAALRKHPALSMYQP